MKTLKKIVLAMFILAISTSCGEEFLDIKPSKKIVVPTTLEDIRALIDNTTVYNKNTPYLGEISSDDYFITDDRWNSLTVPPQKNAYIWADDVYEGYIDILDWVYGYERVYYANIVLENLLKVNTKNEQERKQLDEIRGAALFLRAKSFFEITQIFCKQYDVQSARTDLGIPLKLDSALETKISRSSVHNTYEQILQDLLQSIDLLSEKEEYKTRPTKSGAYAMLAKVYLQMFSFDKALEYANKCLEINNTLLDFNTLNTNLSFPIGQFNDEVIFHSTMISATILSQSRLNVETELLDSYSVNDLRVPTFFTLTNTRSFKGSYSGGSLLFTGLSTNEMWLIKSECLIRLNQLVEGIGALENLLLKRYKTDTYIKTGNLGKTEALKMVLDERRKELVYRGVRWSDLRRYNKENNQKTLRRNIGGREYLLLPNDNKYTLPIPGIVLKISNIEQNPR